MCLLGADGDRWSKQQSKNKIFSNKIIIYIKLIRSLIYYFLYIERSTTPNNDRSTFLVRISNPTGPHPDLSGRILKKAEGERKVGVE